MTTGHKRATIMDVAAHAGVSTAAVSKVLRGAYGTSQEMKDRVQTSIDLLDYRPLASARGMRGRTFTIGVAMSDIMNPFFGVLVESIADEVNGAGFEVFVGPSGGTQKSQTRMVEAMLDHQMDGLILIGPLAGEPELHSISRRVPLVLIGQHGPAFNYDTVANDDLRGAELVVEHLASLGHTRIAHVSHPYQPNTDPRVPGRVRAVGFAAAMERRGLQPDILNETWTREGGVEAVRRLLERPIMPTAIFGGADVAALGVLNELLETGHRVPEDVSVAGYDNTPTASLRPVSLTSVDQSGVEMGARSAQLLLERIGGRTESVSELIRPSLMVRRTTGAPRD